MGFLKFKEQFPKFMENITRRQFTYMVSNFKDNGTIQRRTGSGRPGLSMKIADQVVANLTTPPSSPHRKHKSQRGVACLLGIAQSTVSKLAKLRKLKCLNHARVHVLNKSHKQKRMVLSVALYSRFLSEPFSQKWKDVWFSDEARFSLMTPESIVLSK